MILNRVHVSNFRAIRSATVELGNHTAILGANGAGKSTIVRAIERFYAPSSGVELDDFFGRRTTNPIEIALTFTEFSEDERERFGDRIHGNEMSVTRVFEAENGRANGRYYGSTMQNVEFQPIRDAAGAADKKKTYGTFREQNPSHALPKITRADEIEECLRTWEAANPARCRLSRDDGQFFGFSNVGRGSLQKSTSFVFIPAVRDASADSLDARGAVVARLMELVVRSAIQRRRDIQLFQNRISSEYRELVDPDRLPEINALSTTLTGTLRDFYAEAEVTLSWRTPDDFTVPLPTAEVRLQEEGFSGPVDRKGHGLQRAFILTLLQHLAKAGAADVDARASGETSLVKQKDNNEARDGDATSSYVLPGLILAIEEPELYQHPTKQRHFARVLTRLADGSLPGVATQTQVIFASHSSLFVSLDRFDEVRLARRQSVGSDGEKECRITHSTLAITLRPPAPSGSETR